MNETTCVSCPNCKSPARPSPRFPRPRLTKREGEVLLAWLRHDSKRAAAKELFLEESTVSKHIERIRLKYAQVGRSAPSKASMLARAIQDGLIEVDDF